VKRFVFRLERLLQFRARAEREQAQVLGLALREEEGRRDAMEQAADRLGRIGEQLAEGSASITSAGTLCNLGLTVKAAVGEIEAAERSHREALDKVETEQERYGVARKERRVVERLREHRQETWTADFKRYEQQEQDGLARHQARERSTP
jgi:flagellar export protein FliJ